jgi:2-phosphosulfolactate phosphatase
LRPAIEDLIGAGAILTHLSGQRSPEALLATVAFEGVAGRLLEQLTSSASGRELVERGYRRDVELASQIDSSGVVPILTGEAFNRAP